MSNNNNTNEFIDVKGIINGYMKRWYWFLISVIICGACAYVYVKTHPRQSMVRSSILVAQDEGTANILDGLGGLFGADPYVQDEIFVITSHSVLKTVAQKTGANKSHYVKTGFLSKNLEYPEYPVDVYADPKLIDTLSATLDFKIKVDKAGELADVVVKVKGKKIADLEDLKLPATIKTIYGSYVVAKTDYYKPGEKLTTWVSLTGFDSAAEDLGEDLMTDIASKKSNVIELAIKTTNPEYGCAILNTTMQEYNNRGIEERNQRAEKTAAFIAERLSLISADLSTAENSIEKYKEGKGIVDVGTEAMVNTQLKTEAEAKLLELETRQEVLRMTAEFLAKDANKYELMPVQTLDLGGAATSVSAYNQLILRRMTLLNGAKPGNKSVKELDEQIDVMRNNIVEAIQQAMAGNSVAIKDVRAKANQAVARLGNVPTQEREYINLKRQQEIKQQLYLFLLQRSEETAMLIANAIPKGQVIDTAYEMRDPVGMGKFAILAIAILIGLVIPIVILYIYGLLRNRIDGRADIEKITSLPIIGEMCTDKSGDAVIVSREATSSAAELFRMIRTNLQFVMGNPEDKVVMVTSSMSGEGKSFISINLAASLALSGNNVVLVGLDIRKPQLANYLGISAAPGVSQYLANSQIEVNDIIKPLPDTSGLSVIVAGPIPPNPGELMTSARLGELIEELRERFDYIVLDTAPIGMVSDSFNLSQYIDATIFVVRDKKTRLQDVRFLNQVSKDGRLKRTNILINGTSTRKGYGYGYHQK